MGVEAERRLISSSIFFQIASAPAATAAFSSLIDFCLHLLSIHLSNPSEICVFSCFVSLDFTRSNFKVENGCRHRLRFMTLNVESIKRNFQLSAGLCHTSTGSVPNGESCLSRCHFGTWYEGCFKQWVVKSFCLLTLNSKATSHATFLAMQLAKLTKIVLPNTNANFSLGFGTEPASATRLQTLPMR